MTRRVANLVALAVALCALSTRALSVEPGHAEGVPDPTPAEPEFTSALDRETQGRFSQLLAARDPALAIEHFDALLGGYTRVADKLYADYSDDSSEFSIWWAEQLVRLGLGDLSHRSTGQLDFFREQLESQDFERVVHGYYVLSLNLAALRATGVQVTALRRQMLDRAKADEAHRFWISLWLAESRLLEQPFAAAVGKRTERVNSSESVKEYIGKNAQQLGPRIHRILDLPGDLASDRRVTHYYLSEARRAAEDRVRRHGLLAQGKAAGYESVRRELTEFRTGTMRSLRFQQMLEKDLHYLFDEFGLPADPDGMLELIRALHREKGKLSFALRVGIDELASVYQARMIAEVGGTPRERQAPPVSIDEMLQLGPDGARAFLLKTLNDPTQGERIHYLLGQNAIAKLIETFPPEDPSRLKAAVIAGYASIGHPAALRANYLAALSALESLAPERAAPIPWSSREIAVVSALFAEAADTKAFAKAFRALHRAAESGAFPHAVEPSPELVRAIAQSGVRLIQPLDVARRVALAQLARADQELGAASQEVRQAQRAASDHNREIGLANAELVAAEDRFEVAVSERNRAVEKLNGAVSDVNGARLRLRDARQRGASASERAERVNAEAVALSRVASLEQGLDATIKAAEQAAARATGEAEAAEQKALTARDRAQSARQRAQAAALRENGAYDRRAAAQAKEAASTAAILEILNQSALGLHWMGVDALDTGWNGRLAALLGLAERAFAGDAHDRGAVEGEFESDDGPMRELAKLVAARAAEPTGVFQ